ncbi:hypothetical protein UFOVP143_15 [uncultured Caudovirales phage]|uniref:Uncharacterized protein n=1 Tax=uncultured Caudovirales phage TaxID=2100421 RepID=A0A6J7VKU0_9CAUD|nr:hypothetical protein UFOVP143_15 [uncultured Caudovirales phage]
MSRLTQARIDKAVKAVTAASGAAQVIIDPDGTVRILPADQPAPRRFDKRAPVDL